MKNQITKYAFLHALGAICYIALVAILISNIERLFAPSEGDGNPLNLVAFLSLFVISAAVMAITIFGRPVMWYLDGKKKEAVNLILSTVGFLILFALVIFFTLIAASY